MLYSHRNYGAELLLDDVLQVCEGDDAAAIASACAILGEWDRTANIDSRGVPLWTEFWKLASGIDGLYAVPFDQQDPVNTPRGIAVENPQVVAAVREALAAAQQSLQDAGIDAAATWGELQFAKRNG
jgi:acyl-homoserine-lactone acylase